MAWGVRLVGHDFDLLDWQEELRQPFDPWVEVIEDQSPLYVLRSSIFASSADASEARARAKSLVERLNGAMALARGSEPVQVGAVVEFVQGHHRLHHFLEVQSGRFRMRGAVVDLIVSGPEGALVPPPPPARSDAQKLNEAAGAVDASTLDRAELVADLLAQVGRAGNWYEVYKVFELAEKLCGGKSALKARLESDPERYEIARATANHHRHARYYYKPDIPAEFGEAISIARDAAKRALEVAAAA
ncbi:hypothetical protein [Caulobacter sp. 17J80-11]|uniref:hypothetical protein n=1 Tax=Caulobacter sp. 17J80-11 TaxID=2763502 RepID=UPI0016535504|nr:hypothetical protein [Caulobacter sp. 17J80-11]MBC6983510.1 hypothetical protein [Caulobacter sp. 17J80-11]